MGGLRPDRLLLLHPGDPHPRLLHHHLRGSLCLPLQIQGGYNDHEMSIFREGHGPWSLQQDTCLQNFHECRIFAIGLASKGPSIHLSMKTSVSVSCEEIKGVKGSKQRPRLCVYSVDGACICRVLCTTSAAQWTRARPGAAPPPQQGVCRRSSLLNP